MSRNPRLGRPALQKEPVIKLDMKIEEATIQTLADLEKQMLELMLENLELKQARERLSNEVEVLYRRLSPLRLTSSHDHQRYSPSQSDFENRKLRGEERPAEGVQDTQVNNLRNKWGKLRRHLEKLQAQASRPTGYRRERDPLISSTDQEKELVRVKEELRDLKLKVGGRFRGTKSQEQELQELRREIVESKKMLQIRDLELEELRQEVAESRQIAKDQTLELDHLRQEMEKSCQAAESRDQELAALKQAIAESQRAVMESPELEALRQEIAASRELICHQQQLLQEQLATSLSSEVPTPLWGSYFLEEQHQLQEDRARFEEQKRIFQEERHNFTEAAIRLGWERKNFEEERGLLAKHYFLSSPTLVDIDTAPWTRSPSRAPLSPKVQTFSNATVLLKPACTPFSKRKISGSSSTPKCAFQHRLPMQTVGTPSTTEQYSVMKINPEHRRLSSVGAEPRVGPSGQTPRVEYRKTPAWDRRASMVVFSPETDCLPDYILYPTTSCSPHQSSSVETTPVSLSKGGSPAEVNGLPTTAELYRVLGLTAHSSQLSGHRSSVGSREGDSLEPTPREESMLSSSSKRGSATPLTNRTYQTGFRESGNTPLTQADTYSEICSNLLSRFLDASY
ncbi:afadin- and alpha-actinin-binding protein-like [Ambystoma mexicanum]|uniref:afadin- and alpha-actinin-binding protein-like n=1 Tax=Ambystoma mexicanum TaxID=8296 RepID=UPI0037E89C2F